VWEKGDAGGKTWKKVKPRLVTKAIRKKGASKKNNTVLEKRYRGHYAKGTEDELALPSVTQSATRKQSLKEQNSMRKLDREAKGVSWEPTKTVKKHKTTNPK